MKRLGLLRHAKSDQDDLSRPDFERGLNDRGRRGAALMGRHIAQFGQDWSVVLASPAVRVRETLAAAGAAVPALADPRWDRALYLAEAATLFDLARAQDDAATGVLIAAHNPGLQEALLELVAEAAEDALFDEAMRKFPTAAFAVVELPIDHWSALAPRSGRIVHFTRPRDLDPALGPEPIG